MLLSPQLPEMLAHAVELAAEPVHASMASAAERNEELLEVYAWPAVMNNDLPIGAETGAAAAVSL